MDWKQKMKDWWNPRSKPISQERGEAGEAAAARYLTEHGLDLLCRNYRGEHGEIDLVLRDKSTLVFVEVKSRTTSSWTRPAAAVNRTKQRRISRTALEYLRDCGNPQVCIRFDIVEVLTTEGTVTDVRQIADAFPLAAPYRYG